MAEPARTVCLGMITGVHGVRGLVKLQSFTDPPEALRSYRALVDETGAVLGLEILSQVKGQFLAKIAGVTDRDLAERLKGKRVFVSREALPAPLEGEFYHVDLIGMETRSPAGETLGKVVAVNNYGASDILEIEDANRRSFMVPFTGDFVPEVNLTARFLVLAGYEETE